MDNSAALVDRINVTIRLRRVFALLRRRWGALLLPVVVGLGAGAYGGFRTPDLFRATVELEVTGKPSESVAAAGAEVPPSGLFASNQVRLLSSGSLQAAVRAAMRQDQPSLPEPAGLRLSVAPGPGPSFRLTAECAAPEYARRYVSNWAGIFVENFAAKSRELLVRRRAPLEAELRRQTEALRSAEQATAAFRAKHLLSQTGDLSQAQRAELAQLQSQLVRLEAQQQAAEKTSAEEIAAGTSTVEEFASAAGVSRETPAKAPTGASEAQRKAPEEASYAAIRARLAEKTDQLSALAKTLRPKHPAMVALGQEIERLNRGRDFELQLAEEKRQAALRKWRLTEERLRQRAAELARQVEELSAVQEQFQRLQQTEDNLEQGLAPLRAALLQLEAKGAEELRIEPVGEATTAWVNPHRGRTIALAVGAGLLAGLVLTGLLHRLDDRLELAEDIEAALQQPVLGQLPQVDRRWLAENCLLAPRLEPKEHFAEALRGVRSAVFLGAYDQPRQVLLVTSPLPRDGRTIVSVNFAASLAAAGRRVLLVDADLRGGCIHEHFKLPQAPGLADVLAQRCHWCESVRETELSSLWVVTAGSTPEAPGELLLTPALGEFLNEARDRFDCVVIDSSALASDGDTASLAGAADGVLMVVRTGRTPMRFAKAAIKALVQRGGRLAGVVLNGIAASDHYYDLYARYYRAPAKAGEAAKAVRAEPRPGSGQAPALAGWPYAGDSIAGQALALTGEEPSQKRIQQEARAKLEHLAASRGEREADGGSEARSRPEATEVVERV